MSQTSQTSQRMDRGQMRQREQRSEKRRKREKGYHKILAWQRAHEFTLLVYELTDQFPREELYGLTKQLRDATVSVPANIVEGYSRNSTRQYLYHLNVAWGSLAEAEYYLELASDRGYINTDQYESVEALRRETAYLLHRLILSIAKKAEGTKGTGEPKGTTMLRETVQPYTANRDEPLSIFDAFYPPVPFSPSGPFGSSGPSDPSESSGSFQFKGEQRC